MSKNPKLGCESQDVRTEFFDARGWGGFPNPLWSRKSLCDPIENHKATCWGAWMLGAGRLANLGKIYFWAFNLCLRRCFSTSYVPHLAVAGKLDKGNRNWANSSERGVEKFLVCWFAWPWILGCFVTSSLGICVIYWRLAENQWQVYHGASCGAGWACIPLRANTVKHSTLVDFQGLLCVQTLRTPACFWDSTLKTRAMTQGSLWARRQWLSFPSAAMSSPNLVQQLDASFYCASWSSHLSSSVKTNALESANRCQSGNIYYGVCSGLTRKMTSASNSQPMIIPGFEDAIFQRMLIIQD